MSTQRRRPGSVLGHPLVALASFGLLAAVVLAALLFLRPATPAPGPAEKMVAPAVRSLDARHPAPSRPSGALPAREAGPARPKNKRP